MRFRLVSVVTGMTPAITGTVMPASEHRAFQSKNALLSKNSCVMMKSAPASTFALR